MATTAELVAEIASGEARLARLQGELQKAVGLQKSALLQEIVGVAMRLEGLVHEEHAQGWSNES